MCAPPDSGRIRMHVATSTLLHRRHDLRELERNVTHQAAQVTQKLARDMNVSPKTIWVVVLEIWIFE